MSQELDNIKPGLQTLTKLLEMADQLSCWTQTGGKSEEKGHTNYAEQGSWLKEVFQQLENNDWDLKSYFQSVVTEYAEEGDFTLPVNWKAKVDEYVQRCE